MQREELPAGALDRQRRIHRIHLRDGRVAGDALVVGFARGHPPGHVVLREAELGQLVHDDELPEVGLFGKLAAESHAVVEEAENHIETAVRGLPLAQRDGQFVVVVADEVLLAPDLLPGLVEGVRFRAADLQPVAQGRSILQFEAQCREVEQGFPLAVERVADAAVAHGDLQREAPVGRADRGAAGAASRCETERRSGGGNQRKVSFHRVVVF